MNMQNDHEKTCSMALPERLESLCDRFESAWVAGRRPALEDFLAQVEEADRSALLRELLGLELEYRARLGDRLTSAEYRQRLPGYEQLVEDAFVTLAPTSFAASAPSKPVMVLSTPQLLEALQQYQLLDAGRLEELARTLPAPLPEPAVLAGDLVRRSWLTFYQADQLLHGNGSHLVLGSYVLLERMGEGGMGTVYKARHRPMDRIVAVKIIKSERLAQRDALRRFQREVRALAQLSHPNIVTAYDADRAGERSFLVMEHVEGLDLHRLVRESGPLTPVQACEYVRQAALGLQHASERGLVHRDVKPSNLLLDREQSIIKLLDLGLARREGVASATVPGELTGVGMMLGTPDFMAPEQAVDPRQADIRADIYSLGCTLYFLLAGRPPFPDGTLTQKLLWHQHAEPEPIGSLRPDVPAGLSAVLRKMLAKRPEERYQAPAEVAAALAPFANANLAKPLTDATELSLSSADAAALPQVGKLLKHVGKMLVLQGRPEAPPSEDATAAMSQATAKGKPTPLEKKQVAKILKRVGKMLVQMGKLLAVLLVVVGVYLFYFRSESADQFQTRVRDLIRQEKYQEALEQIDASRQDEGIKTPLQKEVRDQALAWADLRLKQQEDAKQVSELMAALRQRFSDDREVTDRLIAALQVVAKLQVEELQAAQRLKDALNLLKQSEFATTQWALAAKKNLLTRWTGEAAALLQEKDFDKADQVAQDILDQEPAYPAAFTIRQQAAKATAAVNSKVDELVNKKEFAAAAKHVKDHWPRAQDRFRAKILPGWYAVVAEERNKKERDKATATLADLKAHYPEEGAKVDQLVAVIARDGIREQVQLALAADKLDDLQKADQLLQGDEGKVFEPAERGKLQQQVSARLDGLRATLDIPMQITDALRLRGMTRADFERSRAALSGLAAKAADHDKKRIDTLLRLLTVAQQAAEKPLGPALAAFDRDLTRHATELPADNRALQDIYNRLLDSRIRQMVRELPEAEKGQLWKQGLADVKTAKGNDLTVWARAWRLECLAEMKEAGQTVKAADWEVASKALQGVSPGDAAPFVRYVRSLADGLTGNRDKAARQLVEAYGATDLSPILQVPHRKTRAASWLVKAAEGLRQPGNLEQPFGSKPNADTVSSWLQRARALQPNQTASQLPLQMALAAWSKTKQDKELAGSLTAQLTKKETLADLNRLDAYLVLVIHAATRDDMPAGRRQALDSYVQATELAQDLLAKNPDDRAFAEHVYRSIIVPATAEKGSRLLGKAPSNALKQQLARLCARFARTMRADLYAWSKVPEMGDNPLNKVGELYAQAYDLDGKAEYLVNRAFLQCRIADPNIPGLEKDADTAIATEDGYWGGHSLKGLALFYRSRQKETTDYADKVKALRSADQYFKNAADRAKTETNTEELSNLYRLWSSVSLELGNYLLDNPKEKATHLHNAEKYALKATEFNKRNLEAWDALAYALEDVAWLLEEPAKYAKAVETYDQAIQINFRSDRPRSWLGRGRARFRWGEATNDVRKMDDADSDLGEVIERAPKSREAAEAHYWQARIAQFRSGKESEKPKGDKQVLENFLKRAEEGYKTCLELARANQAPSWEEAALTAWAHLALAEGERRKEQATPKADHYVKLAEKLALDLARFNVPEAALIQSRAVVIRTGNLKEAQRICAGGMQQHRTQDKGSLLKLRLNDIHLRLRMEGADMAMLVKEARAVAEEVVAARLDDDTRGFAEGTLGVLLYLSAAKASGAEKDQLTKEAIAQFRAAVKRAPKHGDGYMWRWLLVAILDAKPSRTAAETQEARQRIAEARRMMPASSPYRKNIQELDRRYNDPP